VSRYYEIDGNKYRSVTTILGVIGKGALTNWYAKLAAERAVFAEQEWHAIQQELGDDEAVRFISSAANIERDVAALRGSAVHDLIEHYPDFDRGLFEWYIERLNALKPVDREHRDFIEAAYGHFVEWWEGQDAVFVEREFCVYDPEMGYAGTADALVRFDDGLCLLDVKTSKGVYNPYALQLAAYLYADRKAVGSFDKGWTDAGENPALQAERAGIIQVRPDGVKWYGLDDARDFLLPLFRNCVALDEFNRRKDVWG
jgi:hypothetical protein